MMMRGKYIFDNGKEKYVGYNLITLLGESFFMNRAVNNVMPSIQYILLGTSSVSPRKTDLGLGNETVRKKVTTKVNLKEKEIQLMANFSVDELENTSEIGVSNGEILISHDVYTLPDDFITENVDSIKVTYVFELKTLSKKSDWVIYVDDDVTVDDQIYYVYENSFVTGVYEENSNSGYKAVQNIKDMGNACYYYDNVLKLLLIKTTRGNNPNNYDLSIQTK